ncbi:hypothetical protein [Nesterenkonia sp. F]|uniref:hypothetical protein n=1 Tax=Nesterenkonia sp. F TaxID=795955 RepID=UPI000255CB10|nr:hypothetical protein [Nesterenkonia sp. F]
MVRTQNTEAIAAATARPWADWVAALDAAGAADRPHGAIAELAAALMPEQLENPGWWAQGVAVGYEQHRGLRVPGQRSDGTFHTSASRTLPVSADEAMRSWRRLVDARGTFDGAAADGPPSTSATAKRRHWRVRLDDGTRAAVSAEAVGDGERTRIVVQHERLASPADVERWKQFWKALLTEL